MSASGVSPFTHGRLSKNQRRNLSLLAGGDCADWRLISVTPKSDHAEHRTPVRSSSQRYLPQTPNAKSQTPLLLALMNHASQNGSPSQEGKTLKKPKGPPSGKPNGTSCHRTPTRNGGQTAQSLTPLLFKPT
jgi:hypothetical protein